MQWRSVENASGKVYAVVFDAGDIFPDQLLSFAKQNRLFGGCFAAVGAFSRVTLGFFDLGSKEYKHNEVDEQVEVASLLGNIAAFNDQPKIHAHVVVGRSDGTAMAGHLIEGIVRPTLEIFVYDSNMRLTRETEVKTGLPLMTFVTGENDD